MKNQITTYQGSFETTVGASTHAEDNFPGKEYSIEKLERQGVVVFNLYITFILN